jgi:outer membrane lipoprotein-sorting protein
MTLLFALSVAARADAAADAFAAAIAAMAAATDALTDCTYTFHQHEVVGGSQQPAYVMQVKYRRPRDIYMTWTGDEATGRQLLYRDGWNNGKMRIDPGPWVPTVNLDPHGSLAMHGQRHSIDQVGFVATVPLFVADAARLVANPALVAVIVDEGADDVYGEPAHCFHAVLPKSADPGFYADEVDVCVHDRTRLPARIRAYEGGPDGPVLVEEYGYEDVKVDVGLTDADFEPDTYGL